MLDVARAAVRSHGDRPDWERRRARRSRILVRGRRVCSPRDAPRTRVSCGAPAPPRRNPAQRLEDTPDAQVGPRPAAISSALGAQHVGHTLAGCLLARLTPGIASGAALCNPFS